MQKYVSVVIPVYNRLEELSRAIKSVLRQSYKYFELIIIDDGSDIDIKSCVDNFNDSRIKYLKNDFNRGVSYSRNRGINESKYDYIAFLDSDDEWKKDKLKLQIEFLENNPQYKWVHTEEIWIKNGERINQKKRHKKSGGNIFVRSLELCLISPSSVLIKKELFQKYGLFDEDLIVCEDYDMWLRILTNEEIGFIEKPLVIKYGGHNDQLSKKYPAMDKYRVKSLIKILNSYELSNEMKNKLMEMIIFKSKILMNGALKRNIIDEYNYYFNIIKKIENDLI